MNKIDRIVLDTSVLVAAVSPNESSQNVALSFLRRVHESRQCIEIPPTFLFEVYAALNRTPRKLSELLFLTEESGLNFLIHTQGTTEVQNMLEWLSVKAPGTVPTRGGDLAYLAIAVESGIPLFTFDKGMHAFSNYGVDIRYPDAF